MDYKTLEDFPEPLSGFGVEVELIEAGESVRSDWDDALPYLEVKVNFRDGTFVTATFQSDKHGKIDFDPDMADTTQLVPGTRVGKVRYYYDTDMVRRAVAAISAEDKARIEVGLAMVRRKMREHYDAMRTALAD